MCTVTMVFRPRLGHQHPIVAGHIYLGCSKLIRDHRSQNGFALPLLSRLKHARLEWLPLETHAPTSCLGLELNDCEDGVFQGQQRFFFDFPPPPHKHLCVCVSQCAKKNLTLLKSCVKTHTRTYAHIHTHCCKLLDT